jgi:hypothetical protein
MGHVAERDGDDDGVRVALGGASDEWSRTVSGDCGWGRCRGSTGRSISGKPKRRERVLSMRPVQTSSARRIGWCSGRHARASPGEAARSRAPAREEDGLGGRRRQRVTVVPGEVVAAEAGAIGLPQQR